MEKTTKEMRLLPVDELIPYVNNARTHSPEQINKLRASLREFGFINPVIIDKDKNIIAGHGRVMAAREEGIKEVPCVLVDYLTEAQKKAYILADNRMALDAAMTKSPISSMKKQKPKKTTSTWKKNCRSRCFPKPGTSGSWASTGSCAGILPSRKLMLS